MTNYSFTNRGQNDAKEAYDLLVILTAHVSLTKHDVKTETVSKRGEENWEIWSWAEGKEGFNEHRFFFSFFFPAFI